ncbi:VWA domain-containing protein [Shewanella sp. 10N.286.54.B9]|uniref:VWA domain-containing protein n=1 Tax=Shewanella sp. 10N.286.54.B9 TaxID=3229719 RepID=UPI00354C4687
MHFIRPEWLLALIPLAILLIFIKKNHGASSSWDQYIAPHLASILLSRTDKKRSHNIAYLAMAWCIAVVALSGPAIEKTALPVYESAQGRVMVMDMSLSMYANDLSPNRLTQSKYRATDLLGSIAEGETGLVAYAGDAFTISPLTRDNATLLNLLPTLTPSIMPTKGSNIAAALEHAKSLLSQSGHISGDVILFTDGISPSQLSAAQSVLEGSGYRLGILAFGSEQGAPIKLPDGQLLRDNANQVVVAKTDFGLLNKLASASNGTVIATRADGQDITQLVDWLATTKDTKASDRQGEVWQDLGGYIALLLLLPALLSFRHGLLGTVALLIVLQPTQPVYANSWDDLWQTQDQQAAKDYQAEQYEAAAQKFEQAQWQASSHYKAGQYDQALTGFEQDSSANGLYNQGNALMQLGQYDKAEKRYQKALELAPDMDAAQQNLALAKQLQQQQDPQSEGDKQKNSDEKQSSDEKQNSEDQQQKSDEQQPDDGQQSDKESDDSSSDSDSGQEEQKQQPSDDTNSGEDANDESQQSGTSDAEQDKPNSNEAPMEAKASDDKTPEDESQENPQSANAQQTNGAEDSQQGGEPASMVPATPSDEPLPPEMERALRAIADDPQVLLRNKMQLEYQKRRRQGINTKENQQW